MTRENSASVCPDCGWTSPQDSNVWHDCPPGPMNTPVTCQSDIGMYEAELCGVEAVPGTTYCLTHGTCMVREEGVHD